MCVTLLASREARSADLVTKAPVAPVLLPAVDGINGKFGGFGGSYADRAIAGALGSISLPLGGQYGFQLDGALGSFDSRFYTAGGAHLFWRDPTRGLIGLYGSATHWNQFGGLTATQFAGEAEAYLGRWTIQGIAGVEGGNSRSVVVGNYIQTYDIRTRFFDKINVAYYVSDDWKAFVGHRYMGGRHALALGSELAFNINGPLMGSLFVEGRIGEHGFQGAWGGLRFYFGQKSKSLIQRHRQDDPIEWTPETLFSITNSGSQTLIPPVTADGTDCVDACDFGT